MWLPHIMLFKDPIIGYGADGESIVNFDSHLGLLFEVVISIVNQDSNEAL